MDGVQASPWTSAGIGEGKMEPSSSVQGPSTREDLCPARAALGHWSEGQGPFWNWPLFSSRLAWEKVKIPKLGPHPSVPRESTSF